jgi:HAD superfamily hydrolase (TIGR01509 family)
MEVRLMSPGRAPFAALDDILIRARHLLIDFDGPICSLFAGTPTAPIADRLREVVRQQGVHLPQVIEDTGNWFEIFSFAAAVSTDLAARVESELTELECAAVATAVPTPHVNDVISACRDSARSVAVISNNSEKAVRACLAAHDLDSQIDLIAARTSCDPAILKPSPYLIDQAVTKLGTSASACIVVGDSLADIESAQRSGALSIGYARTSNDRERLTTAGAGTIILSMADLALRLRARVRDPGVLD